MATPWVPNKRAFLARSLEGMGILRLIERLAARPSLLVLTYHRIGEPAGQPYYAPIWSATPEAFRAQMARLRDTFRVVALDEAEAFVASGLNALREPVALVTFDDGQRDNAEIALPILQALGLPATFFLPTALMNTPRLPWWDHVAYVLNTTSIPQLRLDRPEPIAIDLATTTRSTAIARVIRACLDHDIDVHDEVGFLTHLNERAEVAVDSAALGRALFMTWDQARALVAAGLSIGSHGHSHRPLGRLSPDEQRAELATSRTVLERALGRPVRAVAYPYGWPGAFDATTVRLAGEAGYTLGFTSVEGTNRPGAFEPLALRRLGVGFGDTPALLRARLALVAARGRSRL